jgi:3-isopropylmalate/(R)-2-methylmalate dehydratase large subunit
MPSHTYIERIFKAHLRNPDEKVEPGRIIWINIDVRSARDFGGASVVGNLEKYYPAKPVNDAACTAFTFDCNAPATTSGYADNQMRCRSFAREQGIKVFDVDAGIGSHILIEQSLAQPGRTIVGTDSHMNILGAIGCFGQGMGDQDIAFVWANGYTWFEVPETVKITLTGELQFPVTAKDVALHLAGTLGTSVLLGKAAEFYGDAIYRMTLEERITLASMATEMGAIISLIPPDTLLRDFDGFTYDQDEYVSFNADEDAQYADQFKININDIPPLVAKPGSPNDVVPVADVAGNRIDSAFIGSCTNGRNGDIEAALKFLRRAAHIKEGRTLKIVPATRKVYTHMLKNGILEAFNDVGAIVQSPGCGGCAAGQVGITGAGEVQVSTSNRNFKGKQGKGDTYLASPAVAAASIMEGELVDPREVFK